MIKDGIEYKKCDKCGKLCAKLEMVNWKTCKECVISELEAKIEKMKCCQNCKHSRTEYEHCRTNKHEKWEIKENELFQVSDER